MKSKKNRQFLSFLLVLSFVGAGLAVFNSEVKAEDTVLVLLNNRPVTFGDVPAQIIEGRTMVPYRALGDALGAETVWDADNREVEMILDGRYVRLTINSSELLYGNVASDGSGGFNYGEPNQMSIEGGTPIIVNDRTLVPLRVISESFGATVQWVGATRTVFITTEEKSSEEVVASSEAPTSEQPQPQPQPQVTATPAPVRPEFADTAFFQEVSGHRLEAAYRDKQAFAMYYYDSQNQASMEAMSNLKSAAAAANFKVYGFDVNTTQFTSNDQLKWIYEKVGQSPVIPSLYAVYDTGDYAMTTDFSDVEKLTELLSKLHQNILPSTTPTPSPTPDPNATPSPSPTPDASTFKWREISRFDAIDKFARKERFIYVYYNSLENEMYWKDRVDVIKEACEKAGAEVFYTDGIADDQDMEWWAWEYVYSPIPNPTIFLLKESGEVSFYERPQSVEELTQKIIEFQESYFH